MLNNLKNFFITFLVSALIFGAAAYFISNIIVGYFTDEEETASVNGELESYDETTQIEEVSYSAYTALFIGTDYTEENNDYDLSVMNSKNNGFYYKERAVCADSAMLVHFDKDNKRVLIVNIPTDMNTTYNGVSIKLSKLYNYVSPEYFSTVVSSLVGLQIDNCFVLSLDGFEEIIDGLGGIEFNVPCDMKYTDEAQNLYINLSSGTQKLDGEKALNMLRYVGYSEGNFSRMKTALDFAQALFDKLSNSSYYGKATKLYKLFKENIDCNFTLSDLSENLDLFFGYAEYTKQTYTYPVNTTYNEQTGLNDSTPNTAQAYSYFNEYKNYKSK